MPYRAVLFDFDYTLVDSSRAVAECIDCALRGMSLPAVSPEQAHRTIGLSLPDTLARLAGEGERARAEEFVRLFRARADQVMNDLTVLLPSVPATLSALQRAGLQLGIVSSKYRYRIEEFLAREGLAGLVATIVGGEDVSQPKPDPEGLLLAAARLGVRPAVCLYVGDTIIDAQAAQRAGMSFAAALSGVTRRSEFAGYPVRAFLPDLAALPVLLGLDQALEQGRG